MKVEFIENIKNRIGLYFNSPVRKGDKRDFVFIHINKTGGTSVVNISGKPFRKHLTAKSVIKYIGQKKWDSVYKFTVVRNPYDRAVSLYKYRIKTNQTGMKDEPISFDAWVEAVFGEKKNLKYYDRAQMFLPQVEWLKNLGGKIDIDKIVRFENLNEEFKDVAKTVGISPDLPHLNKTKKTNFRDFYSENSKRIVENHFKEDFQYFKYPFENL